MKDLAKKTKEELMKDIRAKREAFRVFRFAIAGSKTRNTKEGKTLRKDVARLLTEINSR